MKEGDAYWTERISPKEAANYLGYSTYSLARWRGGKKTWEDGNKGPRFASFCGRIWYRRDWLEAWKNSIWAPANRHPQQ